MFRADTDLTRDATEREQEGCGIMAAQKTRVDARALGLCKRGFALVHVVLSHVKKGLISVIICICVVIEERC